MEILGKDSCLPNELQSYVLSFLDMKSVMRLSTVSKASKEAIEAIWQQRIKAAITHNLLPLKSNQTYQQFYIQVYAALLEPISQLPNKNKKIKSGKYLGYYPLHAVVAANNPCEILLQYLVDNEKVDIYKKDRYQASALYYACLKSNQWAVEYLLKKGLTSEVNQKIVYFGGESYGSSNRDGYSSYEMKPIKHSPPITPFEATTAAGNLVIMQLLLQHGASDITYNAENLLTRAIESNNVEVVRFITHYELDIKQEHVYAAIRSEKIKLLTIILEKYLAQGKSLRNEIIRQNFIKVSCFDILKLLFEHGMCVHNHSVFAAIESGHLELCRLILKQAIEYSSSHKLKLDDESLNFFAYKKTLVRAAVESRNIEVVQFILEYNPPTQVALTIAIRLNLPAIVSLFISYATQHQMINRLLTLDHLIEAIKVEAYTIVELLLKGGAQKFINESTNKLQPTDEGHNALYFAMDKLNWPIIELLLKNGAIPDSMTLLKASFAENFFVTKKLLDFLIKHKNIRLKKTAYEDLLKSAIKISYLEGVIFSLQYFQPNFELFLLACEKGDAAIIRELLKTGAQAYINQKGKYTSDAPLHKTVYYLGDKDAIELLLSHGAVINLEILDEALDTCQLDVIELLLKYTDKTLNLNQISTYTFGDDHSTKWTNTTLLAKSIWKGNQELVNLLLQYGALPEKDAFEQLDSEMRRNPNSVLAHLILDYFLSVQRQSVEFQYEIYRAALKCALKSHHLSAFDYLSAHIKPDVKLLVTACQSGNTTFIKKLLLAGAKLFINESSDKTTYKPIIFHAIESNNANAVALLLKHRADPRARYKNITALHWAAKQGNPKMIKMLLTEQKQLVFNTKSQGNKYRRGSLTDIDKMDSNRHTPLHYAIASGNPKAVEKLLLKGAKIEDNILHYAIQIFAKSQRKTDSWLEVQDFKINKIELNDMQEIVKMLVQEDANLYQKKFSDKTPVQLAQELELSALFDLIQTNNSNSNETNTNLTYQLRY